MGTYALTGGSSGIGFALVKRLVDDGHTVINIDIQNADIIADLSNAEGREAAIAAVAEHAPDGLDGLITLAGVGGHVPDGGLVCAVNFFGTVQLVNGLKDLVARKNGSIVLLSSNSAAMDIDGDELIDSLLSGDEAAALRTAGQDKFNGVCYMLSKRALAYWMRQNTSELASLGVRINALAPGVISTPMTDPLFDIMSDTMKTMIDSTPLQRKGQPDEIADFICYLLSPQSSFICGSVLFIDGGYDAVMRPKHL